MARQQGARRTVGVGVLCDLGLILSVTLCDGTQTSLVRPLSWRMGAVRTCECGLPPLAGNPNPLGAIDETLV